MTERIFVVSAAAIPHLAYLGIKKMLFSILASLSYSQPPPSATKSLYLFSNTDETYLRKLIPIITFLYSAVGIWFQRAQATFYNSFSKSK